MLSINTNISSLITQSSLKDSTNMLNQAIERMTTGFKINNASDNAANFSITTNMTTQISAYQVAEENTAMGLDLITTASDIITQMEDHAERLRALSTQARNGTYGEQSINAIQTEANALISEITRLYLSSEYNGISLFNRQVFNIPDTLPQAGKSGFIDESAVDIKPEYDGFIKNPKTYEDSVVEAMASVNSFTDGASGEFKIESAEDLAKLADMVNNLNYDTSNATFYLANDVDMEQWNASHTWTPIKNFKGDFDGNGHVIKNLKIEDTSGESMGLFGWIDYATNIRNLGIENAEISSSGPSGGIVGRASASNIANCYTTGEIEGEGYVGGIIGATGSVACYIESCYSEAEVDGTSNYVGGLIGSLYYGSVTNSYATGNVSGNDQVGGLVGWIDTASVTNSYATGNVSGNNQIGGLIGQTSGSVTNSYATGSVSGNEYVGGLIGQTRHNNRFINSSYSLSNVNGSDKIGGFIGGMITARNNGTPSGMPSISNCYILDNNGDTIGGCYKDDGSVAGTDISAALAGITTIQLHDMSTNLQIGIHGDNNSQLNINTNFKYDLSVLETDICSATSLSTIDEFIKVLSKKQTEFGAVQNRLESALDEIEIKYDNLVSSRSTLRDADIAEISSQYIQQQILQQASAILLSTANQSPSIALQLI